VCVPVVAPALEESKLLALWPFVSLVFFLLVRLSSLLARPEEHG